MQKLKALLTEIKRDKSQRPKIWRPLNLLGPVSFRDLLEADYFAGEGIYVIWGEAQATRPVYVGKTVKGQQRLLEHWRGSSRSPVSEVLKACRPQSLSWLNYFYPIVNLSTAPIYKDVVLQFYERKIARALAPWFWHGGFQERPTPWESTPWYIRDYVKLHCERALNSQLTIEIAKREAARGCTDQLRLRIA